MAWRATTTTCRLRPHPHPSPSPSPDPDPNQVTKTFGLPLECAGLSGYYSKLLFMMLWPIVVMATLIAGYVVKQVRHNVAMV